MTINDNNDIYISPNKKTELEQELLHRKGDLRTDILKDLQYAKSLGDLSENAEYHDAREKQGKNETRIKEIEHILKHATIVTKTNSDIVDLGSEVLIKKDDDSEEKSYTIVGPAEADLTQSLISSESPLGSAMMGKRAGESFSFKTPKGDSTYKIIKIS